MTVNLKCRTALVNIALSYRGVTEEGGDNQGDMVEMFQRAVDGVNSGEPWCMAFIQHCIKRAERLTNRRSNIFRSESVVETWKRSPLAMRRTTPGTGYVMLWQKGLTAQGHAGIICALKIAAPGPVVTGVVTVEGNTSPRRGDFIEREGDGVHEKDRTLTKMGQFNLLGYLDPFG